MKKESQHVSCLLLHPLSLLQDIYVQSERCETPWWSTHRVNWSDFSGFFFSIAVVSPLWHKWIPIMLWCLPLSQNFSTVEEIIDSYWGHSSISMQLVGTCTFVSTALGKLHNNQRKVCPPKPQGTCAQRLSSGPWADPQPHPPPTPPEEGESCFSRNVDLLEKNSPTVSQELHCFPDLHCTFQWKHVHHLLCCVSQMSLRAVLTLLFSLMLEVIPGLGLNAEGLKIGIMAQL